MRYLHDEDDDEMELENIFWMEETEQDERNKKEEHKDEPKGNF